MQVIFIESLLCTKHCFKLGGYTPGNDTDKISVPSQSYILMWWCRGRQLKKVVNVTLYQMVFTGKMMEKGVSESSEKLMLFAFLQGCHFMGRLEGVICK